MNQDMIDQIQAADSKEALAPLAEAMGVKLMARRGLETMRADLLEKAQEMATAAGEEVKPQADDTPTKGKGKGKARETRMLRSSRNGRVFPYTPALAKRRDMKEV